jgi:N6-L-threonylcarbamoyladenine synthase
VTYGPGLSPALWTGIEKAKEINLKYNIPILPINHMEGHIYASLISDQDNNKNNKNVSELKKIEILEYPAIALLISGGHTELIYINKEFDYKKIGYTLDDACGEAFDKVARTLGLGYPGGPAISKLAHIARKESVSIREELRLPRPMLHSNDLNFSFSGLKTSVINKIQKYNLQDEEKNLFCMEFENAVTDVLVKKTRQACYLYNAKSLIIGGGVSANTHIRESLSKFCEQDNIKIYLGDIKNSGDNALMIAASAMQKIKNNFKDTLPPVTNLDDLKAEPNLSLGK